MYLLPKKNFIVLGDKRVPLIRGEKGGCFAKGTLIKTPRGYVPIEKLKKGDSIISFDFKGNLEEDVVSETFCHDRQEILKISLWNGVQLRVTPNHWFLNEQGSFSEIKDFPLDGALLDVQNNVVPIIGIERSSALRTTYNISVKKNRTYIAEGIKVHNKGGGKSAPSPTEDPNSLFSTDILFLTVALGEGPVYRINPNGPQDIEFNEGAIDDLIKLDGDGTVETDLFFTNSVTGTLSQDPLPVFGEETVTPQSMSSPVTLKKGNLAGIPKSSVTLQSTSTGTAFDAIRFRFLIQALQRMDDEGNIFGHTVKVKVTLFDSTGSTEITSVERDITGKTNIEYPFSVDVLIPEANQSTSGYKFTVEKTSSDRDTSKIQDAVQFIGWDEIVNTAISYVRTAVIGYAIKAFGEYAGSVPTITSLVKGKLCRVPSNYDQPILENGDIDWRELEVLDSGSNGYPTNGYRLQSTGSTLQTTINPIIYRGIWDGTFVFAWTQNPVWIIYSILVDILGIPEDSIDKYKFYKVAQYCDGVDPETGKWFGVDGYADGTFRHKPQGQFTSVRQSLVGLSEGTAIKERRFICDLSIDGQYQVIDLISQISGSFRAILYYSGGKITFNVDLPDEIPVAVFNEDNILQDSFVITGIKEEEILTGVEVSYIEPSNHYRREVVRIDDPQALLELNQIENLAQIDATGVTRRSQAIRLGQYLLAASKYIRRKASFKTTVDAVNLTVGEVVAVSQRQAGVAWGYGGRVQSNSSVGSSNVVLEHFTSPALSNTVFTGNTNPLGLRVVGLQNDRVDLYLISNSFTTVQSGNAHSGIDIAEVKITERFKPQTKTFVNTDNTFVANNVPVKNDIWTLGEIDPGNFYASQGDKLFKIDGMERDSEEIITLSVSEYVSNVYADSDELRNYTPVKYTDTISPLVPPPAPFLSLFTRPVRNPDGSLGFDIEVSVSTDNSAYPLALATEIEYASPATQQVIEEIS